MSVQDIVPEFLRRHPDFPQNEPAAELTDGAIEPAGPEPEIDQEVDAAPAASRIQGRRRHNFTMPSSGIKRFLRSLGY